MFETNVLDHRNRMLSILGLSVFAILVSTSTGIGQTALAAYEACKTEAAVDANNCYMAAGDAYWANRRCDLRWDLNDYACNVALEKALVPTKPF